MPIVASRMRGFGDYIQDETASTIKARDHKDATDLVATGKPTGLDLYNSAITGDVACTLTTRSGDVGCSGPSVLRHITVRRMTPRECERLQGFPDDYTQISWRGKEPEDCPNGHRYKAMGNSMAVPVMKWIGERIQEVENKRE